MLKIEVARRPSPDGVHATGMSEATVGRSATFCPVQRSVMDGYVVLDLARCMRHYACADVRLEAGGA